MKNQLKQGFLIILMAFGFIASGQTQGNARIYGYKEPVSRGASPQQTIDENGNKISTTGYQAFNYFIYLVSPSRVYPSEMWLNGQPYAVNLETISQTPVERKNFNNPGEVNTTELVPATDQKVIRLKPVPAIDDKLSTKGRSLSEDHELVVMYKLNGKFYFGTLKNLTILEPAALQ